MNRYETSTPRVAFGIAAMAMTAIVIGLTVLVPAKMTSGANDLRTLAQLPAPQPNFAPVAGEAATRFGRIDVIAVREPELAMVKGTAALPVRKQRS